MATPLQPTEVETTLAEQYAAKLKIFIDDMRKEEIPDPFKIDDGWINEEQGVKHWPSTLFPDIFNFLAFHPNELASKDLSDNKTSKGYSCYESPLSFMVSLMKVSYVY